MAGPWNLNGPAVDFSPLGNLYAGFIGAQDHARKRAQEDEAGPLFEKMLAAYGQQQGATTPGSLSALAAQSQGGATPAAPTFAMAGGSDPMSQYIAKTRAIESSGNDYAVSPTGATGRYQFTKGTWGDVAAKNPQLGLTPDGRTDPNQQEKAMAALTQQNAAALKAAGIPVNPGTLYLAHQQGAGGAIGLLTNPNAPAGSIVGAKAVAVNGGDPSMPAGAFAQKWMSKFGGGELPGSVNTATMARTAPSQPVPSVPGGMMLPAAAAGPAPMQVAQNMPTQNPNGGDPTTGFNTPIGQNVYGQGFNAPLNTRVPLGPQGGAPSAPATMQAQAQSPDPRANAFGSGDPTQSGGQASFYIPGTDPASGPPRPPAPVPAPAPAAPVGLPGVAAAAGGGLQPELRAALAAGLRNPQTRAAAMELWKQVASPTSQFDFQVVGDQLYRTNKRTGGIEAVPGVTKPDVDVREINGRLVAYDKRTGVARDATPEGMPPGARPFTAAEKAQYGIDNGYVDSRGVPHSLGPQSVVNIDQKTEATFDKTMAEGSAKRWNGYIENADKAQGSMGDISTLRELSGRLGSQGSSAAVKAKLGPYAESLGINIEGLSDIQAYESVIQRLAPQLHVAGSGATSDIEFKGMLKALPGLSAHPDARNAIMDTMEAQARYAMQKGDIARDLAEKVITRPEAEKRIRALADPLTAFKAWREANPDLYGAALSGKRVQAPAPRSPAPRATPAPAATGSRPTATGPNGQQLIYDPASHSWVPLS